MPVLANIDHVDTLECEERGGVIRSLTRLARVSGLSDTDYTVLWSGLEAAGIPTVPSSLLDEDGNQVPGFEALLLDDRRARIVDKDKGFVDVTLVYRHIMDGTQEIVDQITPDIGVVGALDRSMIYGKMKCSVQQLPTNWFWSKDDDGNDVQEVILVRHTFPAFDKDGRDANNANKDGVAVQTGEIEGSFASQNFEFEGFVGTTKPVTYARGIIAHTNEKEWLGDPALTWMCSEIQWEVVTFGRYKFRFEFQSNPFGWDPYAVFIDARTNRPPASIDPNNSTNIILPTFGEGIKAIPFLERLDFNDTFQAFFET